MSKNIEMNILTSSGYDVLYPKIDLSNVTGVLPVENGGSGKTELDSSGLWQQLYVGVVDGAVQVFNLLEYNIFMGGYLSIDNNSGALWLGTNASGSGGVLIGDSSYRSEVGNFLAIYNGDKILSSIYYYYNPGDNIVTGDRLSNHASNNYYIYSNKSFNLWLYGAKAQF